LLPERVRHHARRQIPLVKPFGEKVFQISFVKHVFSEGSEVWSNQVGLNFGWRHSGTSISVDVIRGRYMYPLRVIERNSKLYSYKRTYMSVVGNIIDTMKLDNVH